ncbi:MAG: TRAP transporter small permease [Rhizobiaceae bacterium]|nr:TRAP transporter small permease [Rhizobiaceae bacterium]
MRSILRSLIKASGNIGALALLLLAFIVVGSIIMRSMGYTVEGSAELAEILLVLVVFLTLAYTQSRENHVAIELVVTMMSDGMRKACHAASLLVCLLITVILSYGTLVEAYDSYLLGEFKFGTTHFALWPAKLVIGIGFVLLSIELIIQLVSLLQGRPVIENEDN